jgi:hypothetical protein
MLALNHASLPRIGRGGASAGAGGGHALSSMPQRSAATATQTEQAEQRERRGATPATHWPAMHTSAPLHMSLSSHWASFMQSPVDHTQVSLKIVLPPMS